MFSSSAFAPFLKGRDEVRKRGSNLTTSLNGFLRRGYLRQARWTEWPLILHMGPKGCDLKQVVWKARFTILLGSHNWEPSLYLHICQGVGIILKIVNHRVSIPKQKQLAWKPAWVHAVFHAGFQAKITVRKFEEMSCLDMSQNQIWISCWFSCWFSSQNFSFGIDTQS